MKIKILNKLLLKATVLSVDPGFSLCNQKHPTCSTGIDKYLTFEFYEKQNKCFLSEGKQSCNREMK